MLTLTSEDQRRLEACQRVLLTPLEHGDVSEWCSAMHRSLRALLGADIVTVLLPMAGSTNTYSDGFPAEVVGAYQDRLAPVDREVDSWRRQIEMGVWSRERLYGDVWESYRRTEYYNDYIIPNRAFDAVGITVESPYENSPAGLLLHHERPTGRVFGERGLALLRLLYPVFGAGVSTCIRYAEQRMELGRMLDRAGGAALLYDRSGRVLHQTPALTRMLATDQQRQPLYTYILELARGLCPFLPGARAVAPTSVPPATRVVTVGPDRYRLEATTLEGVVGGPDPVVMVSAERLTPEHVPTELLRERFGLTVAEVRVAHLLAGRRSNTEIAETLFISPHTARHHTERVLQKLGIDSRVDVARVITRVGTEPSSPSAVRE